MRAAARFVITVNIKVTRNSHTVLRNNKSKSNYTIFFALFSSIKKEKDATLAPFLYFADFIAELNPPVAVWLRTGFLQPALAL
jgi:hypothetical protein